jgi:hypothetical protein
MELAYSQQGPGQPVDLLKYVVFQMLMKKAGCDADPKAAAFSARRQDLPWPLRSGQTARPVIASRRYGLY